MLFAALSGLRTGDDGGHRLRHHPGDAARGLLDALCGGDRGLGRGARQPGAAQQPDDHLRAGVGDVDPAAVPGRVHPGLCGHRAADGRHLLDRPPAQLRRHRRPVHLGTVSRRAVGRQMGDRRAGADPRRHLWRRLHPDGSGVGRRGLRPAGRHPGLPRADAGQGDREPALHRADGRAADPADADPRVRPALGLLRRADGGRVRNHRPDPRTRSWC